MPNIALIPALRKRFDKIYYVGIKGGREEKAAKSARIPFLDVPAVKLDRQKIFANLLIPARLSSCVGKAKELLRGIEPDVVFCKGGFVSLPCALAAHKLGIPVITHESDMSPGVANKIISRFAYATVTSYPQTKAKNAVYIGNPIRREIFSPHKPPVKLSASRPTVLIVGGSTGALALNKADAFQLPQELARFIVGTVECIHDFLHREDDVHPAGIVQPIIPGRKTHAVQQEAIEDFRLGGDAAELRVGEKDLGQTVERKQVGLSAVKVIQHNQSPFFTPTEKACPR